MLYIIHGVSINYIVVLLQIVCWGKGVKVSRGETAILGLGSGHSPGWRCMWLSSA